VKSEPQDLLALALLGLLSRLHVDCKNQLKYLQKIVSSALNRILENFIRGNNYLDVALVRGSGRR